MADEKKKDEKKDAKAEKAELSPEEAEAKAKKKKLLIMIIGGVVGTAAIGGGLTFFLAGGSKKTDAPKGESGEAAHGDEARHASLQCPFHAGRRDGGGSVEVDMGVGVADVHAGGGVLIQNRRISNKELRMSK
jgi:hypothetical protein